MPQAQDLNYERVFQPSSANAVNTLTLGRGGRRRRILVVRVHYSAAVSVAVIITYIPDVSQSNQPGSVYQTQHVNHQLATEQDFIWQPPGRLELTGGDILQVQAAAGGGVVTSGITVESELLAVGSNEPRSGF